MNKKYLFLNICKTIKQKSIKQSEIELSNGEALYYSDGKNECIIIHKDKKNDYVLHLTELISGGGFLYYKLNDEYVEFPYSSNFVKVGSDDDKEEIWIDTTILPSEEIKKIKVVSKNRLLSQLMKNI